ncbi:peroxisomal membrane protein PEX14 [Podospora fimiseda]|uniref:Peroxisomal membrane protein PEX14 n=1 Tax=Podospora fimiseda TaxID=252190 RepID=A0AAN7H162_9PEZI|nr:peroxisomal membrane protein PEX14 [Podospora fimiseda]
MSDDGKDAPSPPAQTTTKPQVQNKPETEQQPEKSKEETLKQARIFLQDEAVKKSTSAERTEFLKSKGLSDGDIQELLKEVAKEAVAAAEPASTPTPVTPTPKSTPQSSFQDDPIDVSTALIKREDRPPIVTYPEFLTKPTRPPPLMTVNTFLNTVYAFSGLATLVYGTSKFVLEPMVAQLTEARGQLAETTKADLNKLVSKLESTVSEIPVYKSKENLTLLHGDDNEDAVSHYDDPAELFHRDIGVQTSPSDLSGRSSPASLRPESATDYQARRLKALVSSLKEIRDGLVDQSESLADAKTVLNVFNDDLEKLSAAHVTDFVGGFNLYGVSSRNEPNDEIKQARDNIRRVKGVLLSARTFPTTGPGPAR